jgi:hypothetical protein
MLLLTALLIGGGAGVSEFNGCIGSISLRENASDLCPTPPEKEKKEA